MLTKMSRYTRSPNFFKNISLGGTLWYVFEGQKHTRLPLIQLVWDNGDKNTYEIKHIHTLP